MICVSRRLGYACHCFPSECQPKDLGSCRHHEHPTTLRSAITSGRARDITTTHLTTVFQVLNPGTNGSLPPSDTLLNAWPPCALWHRRTSSTYANYVTRCARPSSTLARPPKALRRIPPKRGPQSGYRGLSHRFDQKATESRYSPSFYIHDVTVVKASVHSKDEQILTKCLSLPALGTPCPRLATLQYPSNPLNTQALPLL